MEVTGLVAREIDRLDPAMTFIDVTGLGADVYDRLKERGYGRIVTAVNFGSKARDDYRYANKRAARSIPTNLRRLLMRISHLSLSPKPSRAP